MMEVDQESQQVLQDDTATVEQNSDIRAPPTVAGYSTPQQSKSSTDMTDLTRTFTRRPGPIPKDISPVPDNSTKVDGVSPRPNVRSTRQKTMTMDSCGTHELRRLFAEARQAGSSLEELEAKMVDLFRTKEGEMNGRLAKIMEQMEQMEKNESANNEANRVCYGKLLAEYQMMLEELTSGAYIHVGRLEEHGYMKNGSCGGSCRASSERDSIKAELDSMHEDYSKIYEMYKKMRKVAEDQKLEYTELHNKYVEKVEEMKRMQGKMSRLREDAQNKLERASKDVADCLRERDESLVGLRLKVRQLEMDLKSSQRELEIKKNEATELRDICNQLMSQMEPGSDVEQ